jgi:hypothetical protein
MAGGATRGEESTARRKAKNAGTRFWQNRAPSASVNAYTTHLSSSRDVAFAPKYTKIRNIGFVTS